MRAMGLITGGSMIGVLCVTATMLSSSNSTVASTESGTESISLTGRIRDFPPESEHPDFTEGVSPSQTGRSCRNIQMHLDGDSKPVYIGGGKRLNQEFRTSSSAAMGAYGNKKISWCSPVCANPADQAGSFSGNDNGAVTSAATFAQWFRDVPGVNMSRLWTIRLDPIGNGEYSYNVNDFHPIDQQLLGNGPDEHNFYFTYEIVCDFTYEQGENQFFMFRGDDDCWAFVNGYLMIDHGGVVANREQWAFLDRFQQAAGLVDGQTYQIRFFLAERKQPQSLFEIRTNIGSLRTAGGNDAILAAFD